MPQYGLLYREGVVDFAMPAGAGMNA